MQALLRANELDEQVMRAFFHALETFGHRPDVTGVDVGMKMKDGEHYARQGPVIRIHVREKKPRRHLERGAAFPRTFMGVPVDVIQARYTDHAGGDVVECPVDPERLARRRPLVAGVTIGHTDDETGTLGLLVREIGSGRAAILSADHVLAPDGAAAGDAILQPAASDGGTDADAVATVARWNRMTASAIAFLGDGIATDARQVETGVLVGAPRIPIIGAIVEKSGRTTGVTQAMVDGLGKYDGVFPAMRLVPVFAGAEGCPIADAGDSGAVWYDPASGAGIGLHVKGNADPNPHVQFAVASSLLHVMQKLRVETSTA